MSFGRLWPRGECWVAYVGADDSRRLLQAAASLNFAETEFLAPRPRGVVLATPCLPGRAGLESFRSLWQKIGLLLHAPDGRCWIGLAIGWCQEFPTPLMQPDLAGEGVVRSARVFEYALSHPSSESDWSVSVDDATWKTFADRADELTKVAPAATSPSDDHGGQSRSVNKVTLDALLVAALATAEADDLLARLDPWLAEISSKESSPAPRVMPVTRRWSFSAIFDIVDSKQDRPREELPWWHPGLARTIRKHLPALFAIVGRLDDTSSDMRAPPPTAPALTESVFYASTGDGMEMCFFDEAGADDRPLAATEDAAEGRPALAEDRRAERAHRYIDWLLTVLQELRLQGIWVRAVASYDQQDTVLLDRLGSAWAAGVRSCVPLDAATGAAPDTFGAHEWSRAAIVQRPLTALERGRYAPTLLLNGQLKRALEQDDVEQEPGAERPIEPIGQALARKGDHWVPCDDGTVPDDALGVYLPLSTMVRPEADKTVFANHAPRPAWPASPQLIRLTERYDEKAAGGRGLAEVCELEMTDDTLTNALSGLKRHNLHRAVLESTITACIGSALLARVMPAAAALLTFAIIVIGAVGLAYVFAIQVGDLFASAVWNRLAPTLPRSLYAVRVREYRERKKSLLRLQHPFRDTANQLFDRESQFWNESDIDPEGKYLVTSLGTSIPWIASIAGALLVTLAAALCGIVIGLLVPRAELAADTDVDIDAWLWMTAAIVALCGVMWNACLYLRLRKISLRHFTLRRTETENEARAFKIGGHLDLLNGIGHLASVLVLALALTSTPWAAPAAIVGLGVCGLSGWHSMKHLRELRQAHRDMLRNVEPHEDAIGDPLQTLTRSMVVHREILARAMEICARRDRSAALGSQVPEGTAASFVSDHQGAIIHSSGLAPKPARSDRGVLTADFYADGAYAAKIIGEIVRYSRPRWIVLEVMGQIRRDDDRVTVRPYIVYVTALGVRKLPTGYLALFVPTDRGESVYGGAENPGRQDIDKHPELSRAAGWAHLAELARNPAVPTAVPTTMPGE
jgi:hypothetical protein